MRLALAQVNPCVGDLPGNVQRCLEAVGSAAAAGADLVVLPELAIPGCHPRDILYDTSFVAAVAEATADLAYRTRSGSPVVAGTVVQGRRRRHHPGLHNAAVLLQDGEVRTQAAKRLLRTDDVYLEPRWFIPGEPGEPLLIAGIRIGLLVGGDLETVAEGDPDLLLVVAASPYRRGVMEERIAQARRIGRQVAYANLCGGNDELIFDGRSFVLDSDGRLITRLAAFAEEVQVVDIGGDPIPDPVPAQEQPWQEELYRALVLGVRDFAGKNRIDRAFLGLSGGIDSALVAVVAAEALGPERVTAVAIPSRYTDPRSTGWAQELAAQLGISCEVVELERLHGAAEQTLAGLLDAGTTAENVQARLRAMILMAFVNRFRGMLLGTSNKTELALGYGTLYGDLAGTLLPIGDLTKLQVAALARWLHEHHGVFPPGILQRPPTAELRPDQVDPFDYERVAPAMERLVRANRSDAALRRSEHKRRQSGVILRVSDKAFGSGRLMPITRR